MPQTFLSLAKTSDAKMNDIPIVDGRILVVSDTDRLVVDIDGKRVDTSDFITVNTLEDLPVGSAAMIKKFYFVKENKKIYKVVDGELYCINNDTPISVYTYKLNSESYTYVIESVQDEYSFIIPADKYNPANNSIEIYYNGIKLIDPSNYTITGNNVTILFDGEIGDTVDCVISNIVPTTVADDLTIGRFLRNMGFRYKTYIFKQTTGAFPLTYTIPGDKYNPENDALEVYVNGIRITDITTNGNTVTINKSINANDEIANIAIGFAIRIDMDNTGEILDVFDSSSATAALSAYRGKLLYDMIRFGYDYLRGVKGMKILCSSLIDFSNSTIQDNVTGKKVAEKITSRDTATGDISIVTKFYKDDGTTIEYTRLETITYNQLTGVYTTVVS